MQASAKVVHHIRGRVRIKVAGAKGQITFLKNIQQRLLSLNGVYAVDLNTATGSLVTYYKGCDAEEFHQRLAHQGNSWGLYDLEVPDIGEAPDAVREIERESEVLAAHSELARSIIERTKRLDVAIKRVSNNNLDLKVLLPLGFAIGSVLKFGSTASTPLWLNLGLFSFNSFVGLHRREIPLDSNSQGVNSQKNTPSPGYPS